MIKILILGKQPPPYMGTSVWFETLQKVNWGEEWQVDFFNVNIHQSFSTLGKTRLDSIPKNLALYQKLKKQLRIKPYDLVLIPISQETIGFIKDAGFIRIAAKRAGKVLLMLHGSNFRNWQENTSSFVRRYTKRTLEKTDGMIVLGNKLKALFSDHYSENNIYVVPNGADYVMTKRSKPTENKLRALYLSNLQPAKGITELMDALVMLSIDKIQYEVNVVGQWIDDQTKEYCHKLKNKYQLPVKFLGPLYGAEKLQQFSSADIYVFPPQSPEGHPLVLVEAMAAGLPIISTDQGAISESVRDGINGFVVASQNPEQIAEKLEWLIEHPAKRIEMGIASRKLYEEKFTEKNMIENLKSSFLKVMAS